MDLISSSSLLALGQMLLGGLFVWAGVGHFFKAPVMVPLIAARGIPVPNLVLLLGSAFEAVAGACLVLEAFVFEAAISLVAFTIAASLMLLNFWDMQGEQRDAAQASFAQNVGIIGGLLVTASTAM
jgi:putative oxidoreductase